MAWHDGRADEPDDVDSNRGPTAGPRVETPARPDWLKGRYDEREPPSACLPLDGGPSEADVGDKPRPFLIPSSIGASEVVTAMTRQRAEAIAVLDTQIRRLVQTLRQRGELERWASSYVGKRRLPRRALVPRRKRRRTSLLSGRPW